MEHPISIEQLPERIARFCGPNTPPPLKNMAAMGQAPLKPAELIIVFYVLAYDGEEKIAETASSSLVGMPKAILMAALDQLDNGHVLDGLARLLTLNPEAQERILLNQNTLGETVVGMAGSLDDDRLLQIIAANEDRVLKNPQIIEALFHNPRARESTVERLVELAARNGIELAGISCFEEIKAALSGEPFTEASPTDALSEADQVLMKSLEPDHLKDLEEDEVTALIAAMEDGSPTDEEVKIKVENVQQSIARMNISAKIRLATLGNSTQRAILIRDSNKLVAIAAIKSPLVKESDVVKYSKYRSLPEEAVRYMANKKEWTRHYNVKLNLVHNPRCPLEFALRFLPHLRVNDIRLLERDKNVPQAVARAAKQLRNKRMR